MKETPCSTLLYNTHTLLSSISIALYPSLSFASHPPHASSCPRSSVPSSRFPSSPAMYRSSTHSSRSRPGVVRGPYVRVCERARARDRPAAETPAAAVQRDGLSRRDADEWGLEREVERAIRAGGADRSGLECDEGEGRGRTGA